MLPKPEELVLQEKAKLYDNTAKINNCEGRLLAELQIYPSPRITWEFEMLGETHCNFPYLDFTKLDKPISPLRGLIFSIEEPYSNEETTDFGPRKTLRGLADQAVYGDIEASAHWFTFYLPNTRLQHESLFQGTLWKWVKETDSNETVEQGEEGKYVDVYIDSTWKVRLEVRNNALAWLDRANRNIGTLITTVGQLHQPNDDPTKIEALPLSNALERLEHFSQMLSYANGGFIAPLYVVGRRFPETWPRGTVKTVAAVVRPYRSTPLEELGLSWVTQRSDLTSYLKCFLAFERMMQNQSWIDTFDFVLIHYFQAVQSRDWPVMASATGTALERLSYIILVEEEIDTKKRNYVEYLFDPKKQSKEAKKEAKEYWEDHWKAYWNLEPENVTSDKRFCPIGKLSTTGQRLILLLERIGLTRGRGYNDASDVPSFLEVRNDAVHPRVGGMSQEQRRRYVNQAIQWVDEALLWRLGYSGEYFDRSQMRKFSILPRYDLGTRNPSW